jgi:hypothetical protein
MLGSCPVKPFVSRFGSFSGMWNPSLSELSETSLEFLVSCVVISHRLDHNQPLVNRVNEHEIPLDVI